ncbi:MGDG synthase family glycosyltransferase [Oceanobacillus manasiensis]|uniref:MGDG synthase family glycosyltransferase n=1 Tax=Oceanobacillus manasiensis TaxID=586413 RepID=UPI0005A866AC|nr:glycosyltransferase [Oceanobacillus manasiensis]
MEKEALFLPFMKMASGHHHVADTLMEETAKLSENIRMSKVDILSYSYGGAEKLVSAFYMKWIHLFPSSYDRLYHLLAFRNLSKRSRHLHYELLFKPFMHKLVASKDPSLLFCTHALPSNMASVLKQKGKLNAIIVNVYTDFFVNRVWGIDGIDYHLVPSLTVKNFLIRLGVDGERIYITGIPVHSVFKEANSIQKEEGNYTVLVTGGNMGAGSLENLLPQKKNASIRYFILCGNNEKLFKRLSARKNEQLIPIPYINNKQEMNALYNKVDAVLTKPGGVTISECLIKQKPIFVSHALPGQEKINMKELDKHGLMLALSPDKNVEEQIISYLEDQTKIQSYKRRVEEYHTNLDTRDISEILKEIIDKH